MDLKCTQRRRMIYIIHMSIYEKTKIWAYFRSLPSWFLIHMIDSHHFSVNVTNNITRRIKFPSRVARYLKEYQWIFYYPYLKKENQNCIENRQIANYFHISSRNINNCLIYFKVKSDNMFLPCLTWFTQTSQLLYVT